MAETNTMMMVPFEDIEIGLFKNTRQALRKIPELMDSLMRHGQIEPVVVLYKHYGGNGYTRSDTGKKVATRKILVCGDRRMEAMRRLREKRPGMFDKVKCSLWQGTETDARFLKLAENIDRDDLNPVEIADGILELVNCKVDRGDIADRLGYTSGYVSMLLSIRKQCSPAVLRALSEGQITIDTARDLSKLFPHAEQDKALARHLGVQQEQGKAKAKRETKKETGGKVKPSLKELGDLFNTVVRMQRKAGEKDVIRQEWIGAARAIDCARGQAPDVVEIAEGIVQKLKAAGGDEAA
ncbi:MAG: ParB N-terminal domain-containing protein [Deltaproteobacteria bacterium]|nr:ParB N-terminal domain-containing protein [Deltaproteobacteria bacterium]